MKSLRPMAVLAVVLGGCTTTSDDVLQARGTGAKQAYQRAFDATWEAALCSVRAAGLGVTSENKADSYILAERGMTALSYDEYVAVFLRAVSARETEVEVVSKRTVEPNAFARDWTGEILVGIPPCFR